MKIFGLHIIDLTIILLYFLVVLVLGIYIGAKKTKNTSDFFVAGSKWGQLVTFIFVFTSALAGNEAVLVSGKSFEIGISGVWYWWGFLFATPVYYLFSTYFKRARVYNLAEFFELRYGKRAAAFYSLFAGIVSILFIGIILLAVGKILAGITNFSLQLCIWTIVVIVGSYVFSGGMMSAVLTGLVQGVIVIVVLGFVLFPIIWHEAGGLSALKALPVETWDFTSEGMPMKNVLALNFSAIIGGIAGPWMLPWIAISKDEKAARQCGWGHFGKRFATILFTFYGILFAIILPNISDPEQSFGMVVSKVLPSGYGIVGLLIASFFAAGMSSIDSYATTSSSMAIDFFYQKIIQKNKSQTHYLTLARFWGLFSIVVAALSTTFIDSIADYVKIWLSLMSFLGVPIFFGVIWRKSNRTGLWLSLISGFVSYLIIIFLCTGSGKIFDNYDVALPWSVFVPTGLAIFFMLIGSLFGKKESSLLLNKFYVIMATPIGKENKLIDAGIKLPALINSDIVSKEQQKIDVPKINLLYEEYSEDKFFGAESSIEIKKEPTLPWYYPGFVKITLACIGLIVFTWLITRFLFVWM